MISLSYGQMPTKAEFRRAFADAHDGATETDFPMELVGADAEVATEAINQGIDSHLEAVSFTQFPGRHGKLGINVQGADSLHTFVRRLSEMHGDGNDEAGDLASGILTTLDIEWV